MKFGFIGTGNMGAALVMAVAKVCAKEEIAVANRTPEKALKLVNELGVVHSSNKEIAEKAKFIFLGVKPQMMADMLEDIKLELSARKDKFILVSMAAGLSTEKIAAMAGGDYPVIRIMPNTPVAIGKGVVLVCNNESVEKEDLDDFMMSIKEAGVVDEIPEKLIDAASAVSGCGPAFAYIFMEALADGGVLAGLPRAKAMKYAAAMVAGSAEYILATGSHPGVLKDAVCSPGGSTIEGVHALEANGFRNAAIDAVVASYERTKELG